MVAADQAPAARAQDAPVALTWAAGISAALHGLALLALAWHPARVRLSGAPPPIEVVMIQQPAEQAGQPATAPQPPPSPPSPAAADQGMTAATTPTPPAPRQPTPEVNLGAGLQDVSPLSVSSDDIKPPAPDARFRNLPPHYPAEAVREHAQGTVRLLIHVTSRGFPSDVQLLESSGNASLDAEARRTVALWHFKPALAQGRPVPSDYPINIHFELDKR